MRVKVAVHAGGGDAAGAGAHGEVAANVVHRDAAGGCLEPRVPACAMQLDAAGRGQARHAPTDTPEAQAGRRRANVEVAADVAHGHVAAGGGEVHVERAGHVDPVTYSVLPPVLAAVVVEPAVNEHRVSA